MTVCGDDSIQSQRDKEFLKNLQLSSSHLFVVNIYFCSFTYNMYYCLLKTGRKDCRCCQNKTRFRKSHLLDSSLSPKPLPSNPTDVDSGFTPHMIQFCLQPSPVSISLFLLCLAVEAAVGSAGRVSAFSHLAVVFCLAVADCGFTQ